MVSMPAEWTIRKAIIPGAMQLFTMAAALSNPLQITKVATKKILRATMIAPRPGEWPEEARKGACSAPPATVHGRIPRSRIAIGLSGGPESGGRRRYRWGRRLPWISTTEHQITGREENQSRKGNKPNVNENDHQFQQLQGQGRRL